MSQRLPEPDAEARRHSEQLQQRLRLEIASQGPMPFSQYMERCLYAPGLGYYSAGLAKFGEAGDFITAPELGPLFADCLARLFAPVLQQLGDAADLLELGAGSGVFARDALLALQALGRLPRHYLILEPSADLRERQRQLLLATLPAELSGRVHWLDQPPEQAWRGVLFANEVVDALPATRFSLQRGEVYEEFVGLDGQGRLQRLDRPADPEVVAAVRHLERDLGHGFADGYRSEVRPQLPYWLQAIAGTMSAGLLLLVDYGHVRREYYLAERSDGTLRAYYRHRAHGDPLFLPGLNDLTASVDFTALAEASQRAELALAAYLPQAQLLIGAGLQQAFEARYLASDDSRLQLALSQQVRKLTLPDQMGERFQAMLLTRELERAVLPAELLALDQAERL